MEQKDVLALIYSREIRNRDDREVREQGPMVVKPFNVIAVPVRK